MVELGEISNLLGLRTQDANYGDDGFMATIHNSVEVWVTYG
jgi:hypothetical protein